MRQLLILDYFRSLGVMYLILFEVGTVSRHAHTLLSQHRGPALTCSISSERTVGRRSSLVLGRLAVAGVQEHVVTSRVRVEAVLLHGEVQGLRLLQRSRVL